VRFDVVDDSPVLPHHSLLGFDTWLLGDVGGSDEIGSECVVSKMVKRFSY